MTAHRLLILVKHAPPQQQPDVPAHEWRLSDSGRARCKPLAERLAAYQPKAIVTSAEPKAAETGSLAAEILGLPVSTVPDLHEHDRSNTPYYPDVAIFEAAVREFFAKPDQLVYGAETADTAHARFERALMNVLAAHPTGNLVVVAHGTVITLFVSRRNALEPFAFWKRLGLPSYVALDLPSFRLREVVERLET